MTHASFALTASIPKRNTARTAAADVGVVELSLAEPVATLTTRVDSIRTMPRVAS
jgi:hypothetical protein